jgi:hypothetical protein
MPCSSKRVRRFGGTFRPIFRVEEKNKKKTAETDVKLSHLQQIIFLVATEKSFRRSFKTAQYGNFNRREKKKRGNQNIGNLDK